MIYDDFKYGLKNSLNDMLGYDVNVEAIQVKKINETKDALSIRFPDTNVGPVIYLDDLFSKYLNGQTVEELSYKLAIDLDRIKEDLPIEANIKDNGFDPDRLYAIAINADMNKELLEDLPHRNVEDIAIVPRYRVADNMSMIVHNNICEEFKLTKEELLDVAIKNNDKHMDFTVERLDKVLEDKANVKIDGDCPIYVVTNQMGVDGAVAIISDNAMEMATELLQDNFYIIPSSRHELLIMPENKVENPADIKEIIADINANVLEENEKLSDNLYHYDIESKTFSIYGEENKEEQELELEEIQEQAR